MYSYIYIYISQYTNIQIFIYINVDSVGGDAACNWGIDGNTGQLRDSVAAGVFEPLDLKTQIVKSAIEACCLLLRVDDIVSGLKTKQNSGGGQ